jgi:predicted ATPase
MRRDLPAGTITFLFTDIEGSTKLLHELGAEAYAEKLAEHRRIVREACSGRGGVEVDTQGDAFFVAFPTAREALETARSITEELASGPITLRIGLHTGRPLLTEEGYVGEDVHFAARVAASAHGGQVVLSQATRTLLDEGYPLVGLGEHRLKDIPEPVAIFQLGEAHFPPLKTISNTNLPRPASSFVGRERELEEVLARFERGARLLTVTGPGGSGKTRLALEAAATLVPEYKAGVFWVGLASLRDPTLVTETIAQTLGAKDGLAEHVGERELLLLLDNLEQVIEAAPELSSILQRCPNLTLLVTSRELLRVQGEVEYPVPPLAETEAVSLFCERAQTAASEEISELCRRLDALPLAVELAAARTKALSPAQILERLSQRLDLLKGGRDADPRQQTLRATIEWSYDLLSPEEQHLFARLSVFAGGCTLEAAEDVAEADVDTLQSLVEKSLLRFTNERYWMLETIRDYAGERLSECSGARVPRETHAEWYGRLVERAEPELEGPEQDAWLERLEEDHDNIRAALRWALNDGRSDLALAFAGSNATFWWVRGHWSEGRRWLEETLAQPGADDPALRAKALEGAAHLAYRQLDNVRAKALIAEALEIARELDHAGRVARSLRVLGLVAWAEGDYERFRTLTEESAAFAREAGDVWAFVMALNNLGYLALEAYDFEQAAELFREALSIARERGDGRTEASLLENLGLVHLEEGNVEEARREFSASLHLARRLGFLEVAAVDLIGMAAIATAYGQFLRAAQLLGGAQRLNDEIEAGHDLVEERVYRRTAQAVERELGPQTYEDEVRSGYARTPDASIDLALET